MTDESGSPSSAGLAWELVGLQESRRSRDREAWREEKEECEEVLRALRELAASSRAEADRLREHLKEERAWADAFEEQCRAREEALRELRARLDAEIARSRAAEEAAEAREKRLLRVFNNLLTRLKRP